MGTDEEARFDAFFRDSHHRLLGQAYLLTADLPRAQDLTQEAYERAWIRWKVIVGFDDPEAWTRRVLHNLCISDWRWRSRRTIIQSVDAKVVAAPGEDHLVLLEVLRSLPRNQAKALLLHDGLGFNVAEVAIEMSVPAGTVKSWLSRARARATSALHLAVSTPEEDIDNVR